VTLREHLKGPLRSKVRGNTFKKKGGPSKAENGEAQGSAASGEGLNGKDLARSEKTPLTNKDFIDRVGEVQTKRG